MRSACISLQRSCCRDPCNLTVVLQPRVWQTSIFRHKRSIAACYGLLGTAYGSTFSDLLSPVVGLLFCRAKYALVNSNASCLYTLPWFALLPYNLPMPPPLRRLPVRYEPQHSPWFRAANHGNEQAAVTLHSSFPRRRESTRPGTCWRLARALPPDRGSRVSTTFRPG